MREIRHSQMKLGEVAVSQIPLDTKSRDEIPKLLMGLQYIYCTHEIRTQVFSILEEIMPKEKSKKDGRPGMDLWNILVLGTIRLNCDWDYDKLREMADNHKTLRQMLGHGMDDEGKRYPLQTLKDNVSFLTPEILDRINRVVVQSGHKLVRKKKDGSLRGRCDSFVVETDVHYPTDINLLFDAMRKVIHLIGVLCAEVGITGWRQSEHHIRTVKKGYRKAQQCKRSTSADEARQEERKRLIVKAHEDYVALSRGLVDRAEVTLVEIRKKSRGIKMEALVLEIEGFIRHARRQMEQITRRVVQEEKVGHEEKVFSLFEPHTEWISKGKAGVPQELGLRVGIVEDQYQFILHHLVMEKETDDKVAVRMIRKTKENFSELAMCSFDKGYHSSGNRIELGQILERVILPKKGRLTVKEKEVESSEVFVRMRRRHSAVESAIHGLENHGLGVCRDHGIEGFKRYVGLAVLGRNIQRLGHIIQQRALKLQMRREKANVKFRLLCVQRKAA